MVHIPCGRVVAAAGAAGLAGGWKPPTDERDSIKQKFKDAQTRLDEIRQESLPSLPDTFLTDLLFQINWKAAGVGIVIVKGDHSLTKYLEPEEAKAIATQATSVIDTALKSLEAGGPANVMIAGCVMLTLYQLSMCTELTNWWQGVSVNLNTCLLRGFLLKSDLISLRIEEVQRAVVADRKKLEVRQRKSGAIQAATGVLAIAFGASVFRAGTIMCRAGLGAGVAAIGCAASSWYLDKVDLGLERFNSLNVHLKELAIQVHAPIKTMELRMNVLK